MMRKGKSNPFKPGNGLVPPYLAGRNKEIKDFKRSLKIALSLPQNLVISGLRGTGKTVLLIKFEEICRENKWIFVRREFNPRLCNVNEFLFAILSDLLMKVQAASLLKRVRKHKIGFLSEEEVISNNYVNKLLMSRVGTLEDRFEGILEDIYSDIIGAGYKGLVFLYDEFHSIEDQKIESHFPLSMLLEALSHLQQKGARYFLVLSGLPPLFPNLVRAKTYAERMFVVKKIDRLCEKDSRLAIEKPLDKTVYNFEERLINALVKETDGYPYFLQFYSFQIIENIPKRNVTYEDFLKIRPFILNRLDESFFAGRFERTSNSERELLFEMANLGDEMKVSEIRKRVKKSRGALNIILNSLVQKDIIYRVRRGVYLFTLPLFREFLRRQSA